MANTLTVGARMLLRYRPMPGQAPGGPPGLPQGVVAVDTGSVDTLATGFAEVSNPGVNPPVSGAPMVGGPVGVSADFMFSHFGYDSDEGQWQAVVANLSDAPADFAEDVNCVIVDGFVRHTFSMNPGDFQAFFVAVLDAVPALAANSSTGIDIDVADMPAGLLCLVSPLTELADAGVAVSHAYTQAGKVSIVLSNLGDEIAEPGVYSFAIAVLHPALDTETVPAFGDLPARGQSGPVAMQTVPGVAMPSTAFDAGVVTEVPVTFPRGDVCQPGDIVMASLADPSTLPSGLVLSHVRCDVVNGVQIGLANVTADPITAAAAFDMAFIRGAK